MGGAQAGHAGQGVAAGQLCWPRTGKADDSLRAGRGLQAARVAPSKIAPVNFAAGQTMWVIFLEMGVALGLLLLIVWWTWPKKRPGDKDKS